MAEESFRHHEASEQWVGWQDDIADFWQTEHNAAARKPLFKEGTI